MCTVRNLCRFVETNKKIQLTAFRFCLTHSAVTLIRIIRIPNQWFFTVQKWSNPRNLAPGSVQFKHLGHTKINFMCLRLRTARTLIKKKTKLSSSIRKFRWDRVESHIWGRASYIMRKCANFPHIWGGRKSYMTLHPVPLNFLIYEENFLFFFISANMRKILFPEKDMRGIYVTVQ